MPGITGIVTPLTQPPVESLLDRMLTALLRRNWFFFEKAIWPGAALASVSLVESSPIASRNGVYLAASGYIAGDNGSGGRASPGECREAAADCLSERLLERYLHLGAGGLCGLNGQYAAAVWETGSRKLTIVNDRAGLHRLYYWQAQDRLLFSSEIKALSCLPGFRPQIDEVALSDLLYADHLLDDRTLFEDIKALPGASLLTYQDGRLELTQYWDYHFARPDARTADEQELLEGLDQHIFQAIKRRMRPDTCLLLSGGLDSRLIGGMLHRLEGAGGIVANTIGTENGSEVIQARQIAAAVGLDHTTIPIDSGYLAAYSGECIRRTEGNMNCHASWIFAEDPFLSANRIRYIMTGLFGEVISGRNWAPISPGELSPAQAWEKFKLRFRLNTSLLAEVLRPAVYTRVAGESQHSIKHTLALTGSRHPLNQFDYLYLHQKLRRHSGSADVLGDYCQALDPFTDTDLIDFAFSIPPALRQRGRLYKKFIASRLPVVAQIGYGRSGRPLKELVARENDLLLRLSARGRRLIRGQPPAAHIISAGDLTDANIQYNNWQRTGSRAFILEVLDHKETLADYFNLAAVDRLVADHMAGRRNEFRIIGAILTFSLWRRHFCQGDDIALAAPWH
jgi:asparagine synthase (glutamine-hydrolysing)